MRDFHSGDHKRHAVDMIGGWYKDCDPSITVLLSIRFGSSGKVSVSSERDGFGVAIGRSWNTPFVFSLG